MTGPRVQDPERFNVEVKAWVPSELFHVLHLLAVENKTDVGALLVECGRRAVAGLLPPAEGATDMRSREKGAPRREWTDADAAQLAVLHARHLTDSEIAMEMNRPLSTIGKYRTILRKLAREARRTA